MVEREGFVPGVPCWIDTGRRSAEPAVGFYSRLFGWEFTDIAPPDVPGRYFLARLDGKAVAAVGVSESSSDDPVWNTYIQVDDADATAKAIADAGGKVVAEPFDAGPAGRTGVFTDPAGAEFLIWQPGLLKGAELVNAAGSWNSSDLHTDDIDGATAFYRAVFGWESDLMEVGASRFWLFKLSGYGDFLERFDPEIRTRQANDGAPPGFEDVVGWMTELADQPVAGGSPRFAVNFAVADTDAIARLCEELGGSVLQEPVTIGPVRSAVLADPEGAAFAIGEYDPTLSG